MVQEEEKEDLKGARPTTPTVNRTTGWARTIKKVETVLIDFRH